MNLRPHLLAINWNRKICSPVIHI